MNQLKEDDNSHTNQLILEKIRDLERKLIEREKPGDQQLNSIKSVLEKKIENSEERLRRRYEEVFETEKSPTLSMRIKRNIFAGVRTTALVAVLFCLLFFTAHLDSKLVDRLPFVLKPALTTTSDKPAQTAEKADAAIGNSKQGAERNAGSKAEASEATALANAATSWISVAVNFLHLFLYLLGAFVICANLQEILDFVVEFLKKWSTTKLTFPGGSIELTQDVQKAEALNNTQLNLKHWSTTMLLEQSDQSHQDASTIILAEARKKLDENKLNLRVSPTDLHFENYRRLARKDPRMAIVALRPGMEVLLRNVSEIGPGVYMQGRSISEVLADMKQNQSITAPLFSACDLLFKIILQSENGLACDEGSAERVLNLSFSIVGYYCNWVLSNKKEFLPLGEQDSDVYLRLAANEVKTYPEKASIRGIFQLLELAEETAKCTYKAQALKDFDYDSEQNKQIIREWFRNSFVQRYIDLHACCNDCTAAAQLASKYWFQPGKFRDSDKKEHSLTLLDWCPVVQLHPQSDDSSCRDFKNLMERLCRFLD